LHEEADIFLSVLSLAELRFGAANPRVAKSAQTEKIVKWIDQMQTQDFAGRILGINEDVAALWGNLSAQRSRPIIDTFIAAIAIVHNLTLVTRNVADFRDVPVKLLNPWKA
jgi:predicted nucleic acid-binding protein